MSRYSSLMDDDTSGLLLLNNGEKLGSGPGSRPKIPLPSNVTPGSPEQGSYYGTCASIAGLHLALLVNVMHQFEIRQSHTEPELEAQRANSQEEGEGTECTGNC